MSSVPVFLLAHFLPRVSLDLWLGVYVLFTVCVHLAWLRVSLIVHVITSTVDGFDELNLQTRRLRWRTRTRRHVSSFLEVYGLCASLPEKYGGSEWLFGYSFIDIQDLLSRVVRHGGRDIGFLLWNRSCLFATCLRLLFPLNGPRHFYDTLKDTLKWAV